MAIDSILFFRNFVSMKRSLTLTIAALYLMLSSGLALNLHYCGEKISSINLSSNKEKCCCGELKTEKSCCKDELAILKVKDLHQYSTLSKVKPASTINFQVIDPTLKLQYSNAILKNKPFSFARYPNEELHLFIRILRI